MKSKRTQMDLFFEMLKQAGGARGHMLVQHVKDEILPHFELSDEWEKVISEEEYRSSLAQIKKELPYFLHYLLSHDFGGMPEDWDPSWN